MDNSLILYSDATDGSNDKQVLNQVPIATNTSAGAQALPHNGREITFLFNASYMGQSPRYCHKFKNEPYKIYPHLDTKIAHVYAVHANVGSNDVAVIDYEKKFTFIGGHVTSADHVMWTLTSSSSCETAIVNQHDSALVTKGTGNTTMLLDGSNSALFNFTRANSGDQVRLCYQFGNEPYRTYVEHELDLRMIHNFTAATGETNRSVVAYPKPLTFAGDGLSRRGKTGGTVDRAKWLISPFHFSDCNDASKTAELMDNSIDELAIDIDDNNATFWFDERASGYWVALCYAFEEEVRASEGN